MKIKHIIILTVLLLFSLSAVSAQDNATDDNLTVAEPVVEFDEQMWSENLTGISVELPENTTGQFSVKINDEIIYDEKITNTSFKVPVKLPEDKFIVIANVWPPIDSRVYKVSAFLNATQLTIPHDLKVMKYSPDYEYLNHFPKEILQNDNENNLKYALIFPRSANGNVEIYADDKLLTKSKVTPPFMDLSTLITMGLGKHTLRLKYSNDTYYHEYDRTCEFEVVQAVINIPDPVNIGHEDCISVHAKSDCKVEVYLDSVLISSQKIENGDMILSLEKYLKHDSKEVKVIVSGTHFKRQKTAPLNVVYDFDAYPTTFIYGEENILEVYLPDTLNNNLLSLTLNGVKYSFTRPDYISNNIIEIDLSRLKPGNYTLHMSYPGDSRFKPYSKTVNLTVENRIMCPYDVIFKDSSKIYLNLPGDAMGDLNIYIDGNLVKTLKLTNGHAEYRIDYLKPGKYQVDAVYTGNDYSVEDLSTRLWADAKITADEYFRVGEDKKIIMEVPKNCNGKMTVEINGKKYTRQIKNGKAVFSLKKLKIGDYEVEVKYIGEDGYESFNYYYVEVIPAKIKIKASDVNVLYKHSYKYKIKLYGRTGKVLKNKWVKVKIAKKTYKIKTNNKGVAVLKLKALKLKTYTLKITYGKVKVTKKVHVKLIKIVKNKKYLKVKLYKPLKGKPVTFKMKGKTFKVKSNSKGIAQIKLSKLSGKVTVSYKNSSVKTAV